MSSVLPKEQQEQKQENNEEEEQKKQRESAWRTMKLTLIAFGMSFTCLGGYLIFEFGKAPVDPEGNPITDEFSNMPVYKQYFYRTLKELDYYKRVCLI